MQEQEAVPFGTASFIADYANYSLHLLGFIQLFAGVSIYGEGYYRGYYIGDQLSPYYAVEGEEVIHQE